MRSPRELTRAEILATANRFRWFRKMPKWTVIVDNRELPARPLVLEAAGVPPNDPTNSHQAIAILENLGFETRYAAEPRKPDQPTSPQASTDAPRDNRSILEIIAEATKDLTEEDWKGFPADLSKNVDHYLYGTKKVEE
ncbi:MAG TPA: hypothetical protein VFF95_10450 [Candidatus Binatus sp.]|jgi:hypothetical protein|nr:hypothetical protein [Candidatus Binatus sp.]